MDPLIVTVAAVGAELTPEQTPHLPITPQQLGNWNFSPGISQAEAEDDARAQGFGQTSRMREDDYGDWIGQSPKGALIIFPDGQAFPL